MDPAPRRRNGRRAGRQAVVHGGRPRRHRSLRRLLDGQPGRRLHRQAPGRIRDGVGRVPITPTAGFGQRRPEVSRRLERRQSPGSAGAAGPVEFTGRRGPLFKLLVKNAIFKLLTLWIYRFWAKTWIRRYFWNNIRIDGDPLEYTGLPSELFIGFLIILGILVPVGMAFE
ncbi:MAG: DUF898 family protein, partial [Proteobacteria bacterium]|nr:DUF898 family protein [Pseudomonadota bacterium]